MPVHAKDIIPIYRDKDTLNLDDSGSPSASSASHIDFKICQIVDENDKKMSHAIVGPDTELIFAGDVLDRSVDDARVDDKKVFEKYKNYRYKDIGRCNDCFWYINYKLVTLLTWLLDTLLQVGIQNKLAN